MAELRWWKPSWTSPLWSRAVLFSISRHFDVRSTCETIVSLSCLSAPPGVPLFLGFLLLCSPDPDLINAGVVDVGGRWLWQKTRNYPRVTQELPKSYPKNNWCDVLLSVFNTITILNPTILHQVVDGQTQSWPISSCWWSWAPRWSRPPPPARFGPPTCRTRSSGVTSFLP